MVETKNREDLTALWATVATLRQLHSNKAKGEFLVERFKANENLPKYFRAIYDPRRWWSLREYDMKRFALNGVEQQGEPTYFLHMLQKMSQAGCPGAERIWWATVGRMGPELQAASYTVLNRDLRCGLTHHVVNRALAYAERPTIDFASLKFELTYIWDEQRFCFGRLYEGPHELCEMSIQVRCVREDLAKMAEYGIMVVVPSHLKNKLPRK